MDSKWIYALHELSSQDNDRVGKKCANLGEMARLGLRVPPGFAISVDGYERFMEETGAGEEIRRYMRQNAEAVTRVEGQVAASRSIRRIIESKEMPFQMRAELESRYIMLRGELGLERLPVAVRSSGAISMPGQMETYLNVVGREELCRHVIKVWASAFTARAIAFRLEKGMEMERAPIGVAVLKMIQARSAGVVLTVLPTTGDTSKIIVEGNWGLGESVVSGEVNPDRFVIDKRSGAIQCTINRKTKMVVYRASGTVMGDVPANMQEQACLEEADLREISRVSQLAEAHFGQPQDMEWVIDLDLPSPQNLFWVQARPAKFLKKKESDPEYLAELMSRMFGA